MILIFTVNDETFSDGEEACERAVKLTKCLTENAPKVSFFHIRT